MRLVRKKTEEKEDKETGTKLETNDRILRWKKRKEVRVEGREEEEKMLEGLIVRAKTEQKEEF